MTTPPPTLPPTSSVRQTELRAQRTYQVSDERLHAFGQLSYAQRLQWVEQCSQFVRMAQAARENAITQSR